MWIVIFCRQYDEGATCNYFLKWIRMPDSEESVVDGGNMPQDAAISAVAYREISKEPTCSSLYIGGSYPEISPPSIVSPSMVAFACPWSCCHLFLSKLQRLWCFIEASMIVFYILEWSMSVLQQLHPGIDFAKEYGMLCMERSWPREQGFACTWIFPGFPC